MASLNIDTSNMVTFILRWLFAGVWGAVGWAISVTYLIPVLPGL